jgi:hypothetical protein
MACTTITEILKSCDNNIGGIRQVWLWDMEDVSVQTASASNWSYTELSLIGAPATASAPVGYEFIRNSSNYIEDGTIDLVNGSSFVTATLTLVFTRREAAKSQSIKVLGEGQRYLGALVLDSNGIYWVFNDLQLSAVGDGSGTAKADGSKYTVTLLGETAEFARVLSTTQATNFVADGSTL